MEESTKTMQYFPSKIWFLSNSTNHHSPNMTGEITPSLLGNIPNISWFSGGFPAGSSQLYQPEINKSAPLWDPTNQSNLTIFDLWSMDISKYQWANWTNSLHLQETMLFTLRFPRISGFPTHFPTNSGYPWGPSGPHPASFIKGSGPENEWKPWISILKMVEIWMI